MSEVFVVGALHLDVVVDAPRLPLLDETLFGKAVAYRFGGKGGNQALAAARMGAGVAMAGRVGGDAFGVQVLETLAASGVDHSQVRKAAGATGMSVAIVEDTGEYGAVVVSGVNQTIDPEEVDAGRARVVLLQNEIPEAVNLAVVRSGRAETTIILNAAPARKVPPDLMAGVDILVVNRVEAAQMTGLDPDRFDAEIAAKELALLGPPAVVVTLGADGAVVLENGRLDRVTPPIRANGSAHGAGDAFVGALAAEIARGSKLIEAVEFASASAACFVSLAPDDRPTINREAVLTLRGGRGV